MSLWPIHELVPHAGDMILLDHVLEYGAEHLHAQVTINPQGLFNQADDSLPAWVGIEIMAQGIAAYAGCHARAAGQAPELGFLLGTRQFHTSHDRLPAGTVLQLQVERTLQDDSGMAVFECRLSSDDIQLQARLNVYRPNNIADYLNEPAPGARND